VSAWVISLRRRTIKTEGVIGTIGSADRSDRASSLDSRTAEY
jgi:hypothetical protein